MANRKDDKCKVRNVNRFLFVMRPDVRIQRSSFHK